MPDRSIETNVTFGHAFAIGKTTEMRPAGTYRVVVNQDDIRGVSFLAYHRVATLIHTPAVGASGPHQVFTVDSEDLDTAIRGDRVGNVREPREQ